MSKTPNKKLQRQRELKGWSQEKLAQEVGTTAKIVGRWERGESKPTPYYRQKLIQIFQMNAEELDLLTEREEATNLQDVDNKQKHSEEAFISSSDKNDTTAELLGPLAENRECAWIYAWSMGEEVSNIELIYNDAIRYEHTLADNMCQALDDWCRKNQTQCIEKKRDPIGVQIRLEKVEWSHAAYKYFVLLSPSRYLLYVATHPHLGKAQFKPLREAHFNNALNGLKNGEPLELPSNFALHMAVVSQDGYLLLRRRASNTELYPSAWEAGIGEFMHGPVDMPGPEYKCGPNHAQFPHFTDNGLPDLSLFLKNAVAEELGYHEARPEDFLLYGFAVEYETLAPKLLVVYHADCPITTLIEHARKARDRARELSSLALTPQTIAKACTSSRYTSWGPTSKLVMLLALRQDLLAKGMLEEESVIAELIDRFEPEKSVDIWELHQ
jgi:transcriptional regulator with XRE-family HTH domain